MCSRAAIHLIVIVIVISVLPAKALVLSISDHGPGLEAEHLREVGAYMQFERKQREQQGLGLGLAIAKRLTELHDSSLAIQSEPGTGATVVVHLPIAQGAQRNGTAGDRIGLTMTQPF